MSLWQTNAGAVEGENTYDSDDGCDTNGYDNGSGNDGSNDCAIHSPMVVAKVYGVEGNIKSKMQSVVEANSVINKIERADDWSYHGTVDGITDGAIDVKSVISANSVENSIERADDGAYDGPNDGDDDGPNDGDDDGPTDGCNVGPTDGCNVGSNDGFNVGPNDGCDVGPNDGCNVGQNDGCDVGQNDGCDVGPNDGCDVGPNDGCDVGCNDGDDEGPKDGGDEGPKDGDDEGPKDGDDEGRNDGHNHGVTNLTSYSLNGGAKADVVKEANMNGVKSFNQDEINRQLNNQDYIGENHTKFNETSKKKERHKIVKCIFCHQSTFELNNKIKAKEFREKEEFRFTVCCK